MNPVHEDVAQKLDQAGVGNFAREEGWFIGTVEEPEAPDDTITVLTTPGGVKNGVMESNREDASQQPFQVRVRSTTDLMAYEKIVECMDAIHKIGRFKVEPDMDYTNILRDDPEPIRLPKDTNDRHLYVWNFTAYRQRRNI